jgi:hypothetical protein
MNTGNVESWDGTMTDLGPLYPFVGWEGFMVVLLIIFWIGWHIVQIRMENRKLEEEVQMLRQSGNLQKALAAERSPERM